MSRYLVVSCDRCSESIEINLNRRRTGAFDDLGAFVATVLPEGWDETDGELTCPSCQNADELAASFVRVCEGLLAPRGDDA